MQKILFLKIFLIICTFLITGYGCQKTPSEHSSYKIIQTTKLESDLFNLEIPAGWQVLHKSPANAMLDRAVIQSPDFTEHSDEDYYYRYIDSGAKMHVYVLEGEEKPPFAQFEFDPEYVSEGGATHELIERSEIKIGNQTGELTIYTTNIVPNVLSSEAYIFVGGLTYQFNFKHNPETYPEGAEIFQAILGSVEFK